MAENFQAGRVKKHLQFGESLTSDPVNVTQISGTRIEFDNLPLQTVIPEPYNFPPQKELLIDTEILKIQKKGVIKPPRHKTHNSCRTFSHEIRQMVV